MDAYLGRWSHKRDKSSFSESSRLFARTVNVRDDYQDTMHLFFNAPMSLPLSDPLPSIENRYLPGIKLPENVVACPDLIQTCQDATMLVFVVPHQVRKCSLLPHPKLMVATDAWRRQSGVMWEDKVRASIALRTGILSILTRSTKCLLVLKLYPGGVNCSGNAGFRL